MLQGVRRLAASATDYILPEYLYEIKRRRGVELACIKLKTGATSSEDINDICERLHIK